MKLRFSIRDLLWLTLVVAVTLAGLLFRWIWPVPIPPAFAWKDAKRLIASGETKSVFQAHSRLVLLRLKDGKEYQTVEEQLDEVLHYIEKCGLKGKVQYSTE